MDKAISELAGTYIYVRGFWTRSATGITFHGAGSEWQYKKLPQLINMLNGKTTSSSGVLTTFCQRGTCNFKNLGISSHCGASASFDYTDEFEEILRELLNIPKNEYKEAKVPFAGAMKMSFNNGEFHTCSCATEIKNLFDFVETKIVKNMQG